MSSKEGKEGKESKEGDQLTVINWIEAMAQVGHDRDFLDEVLVDLITESDAAVGSIREGIDKEDYDGVMQAAHRIKGSASYLCCDALKEVSLTLQNLGQQGLRAPSKAVMDDIKDNFKKFCDCLDDLKHEIKHHK